MINQKRIRNINNLTYVSGPVVYWMSRDQRFRDNWALLYCQKKAIEHQVPMVVVFCLVPRFLGATKRQYLFMIEGLQHIETDLRRFHIHFRLLCGGPEVKIPRFLNRIKAGLLIIDFDPLKIKQKWKKDVTQKIKIPVCEVDSHNIVPCWIASDKQEYAAYTFRPKIHKKLFEFLEPFPELQVHPFPLKSEIPQTDWKQIKQDLKIKSTNPYQSYFKSGEDEAFKMLEHFINQKLNHYAATRNDPTKDGVSDLSPYLHFGQISAQKIAYQITHTEADITSKDAFLEESIVRRELSDNFCYYNPYYNSPDGFPDWAKKTLAAHQQDKRDPVYTLEQFENGDTYDKLWNTCQMEMVKKGKMHGYMRMYWAKKILEWSSSVEEAMHNAITLNDRYELDGRDPNGYTGIAWSIGGVHDRAWSERPIFGKVRYMSERGCRSKFNVDRYIQCINAL
jgi:deoxyribodipyrimidine photo-lyase